jgi:endo-1,4-beta-xylanase
MTRRFAPVRRALPLLLAAAALVGVAGTSSPGVQPTTAPSKSLRHVAQGHFLVGCAVRASELDDPEQAAFLAREFDAVTAENEMKPQHLQRVKGTFTFDAADRIAGFARQHDMTLIGHTLVWHNQAPKWLFEDDAGKPLPREAALDNMRTHIQTVVRHFKGRVHGWDVVNEAIDDAGPYLRDTPARRAIGDDYVVQAFRFAREADPDVELYYNDYNIEMDYKRPKALRLLRELEAAGVKPTAVGIQGHWQLGSPAVAEVERGLKAYTEAGYKVMITELDVDVMPRKAAGADVNAREQADGDPYKDGLPDEVQLHLANRYGELFALLMRYDADVTRVTFWGSHDGRSWLNNWPVRGRTNHPTPWDRRRQPKPAYDAVVKAIEGK